MKNPYPTEKAKRKIRRDQTGEYIGTVEEAIDLLSEAALYLQEKSTRGWENILSKGVIWTDEYDKEAYDLLMERAWELIG